MQVLHEVKNPCAIAIGLPNNVIDRQRKFKWKVVLSFLDRQNIPYLMHDTCLCLQYTLKYVIS